MNDTNNLAKRNEAEVEAYPAGLGQRVAPVGDPVPLDKQVTERQRMKLLVGRLVLTVCPSGKKECKNLHCLLQPFCQCARAEFGAGNRIEAGVWMGLTICGAILLLVAFLWAMLGRQ